MDAFPVYKNACLHSKKKSTDVRVEKTTQKIYENANFEFKKLFPGIGFNRAQTEVPELKNKNIDVSPFSYNRSIDEEHYKRKKRKLKVLMSQCNVTPQISM